MGKPFAKQSLILAAAALALCAAAALAQGQLRAYLYIEEIPGECRDENYVNWLDVVSFRFELGGAEPVFFMHHGEDFEWTEEGEPPPPGDREDPELRHVPDPEEPQLVEPLPDEHPPEPMPPDGHPLELIVCREADAATNPLIEASLQGRPLPMARLVLVRLQGGTSVAVLEYELEHVLVAHVTLHLEPEMAAPIETATLHFHCLHGAYTKTDQSGAPGARIEMHWCLPGPEHHEEPEPGEPPEEDEPDEQPARIRRIG